MINVHGRMFSAQLWCSVGKGQEMRDIVNIKRWYLKPSMLLILVYLKKSAFYKFEIKLIWQVMKSDQCSG